MEYLSDKSSVARMDKNLEKIMQAEVIPTGLQRRLVKHSLPWAVLALKSVAGSWTCPKALPVFLKKQA